MTRAAGRFMLAVPIVMGMAAAGCTAGAFDSDRPFEQVYLIQGPVLTAAAEPIPVDLTIARPMVRPGLDTDRIAVLYPDRRMDYFAASRWGATTDVVVQNLLIETLRRGGALRNVQSDSSLFDAEYVLQTEVTRFQAEYPREGGPPQAKIEFVVAIGRATEGRPLATFVASGGARAEDNRLGSVVSAFEAAYAQAASTVVERTSAALSPLATPGAGAQNVDNPVTSIRR